MIPPNWFALFFVIRWFYRRSIVSSVVFPVILGIIRCSRVFRLPWSRQAIVVCYHILIHFASIAIVRQQMGVYIFQYLAIATVRVNGDWRVCVIANI